MRVLFMGSGEVACPALERLLDQPDYDVVAVVTQPDRPKGRQRRIAPCPAKAFAEAKKVPVLTPARIGAPEAVDEVRALRPDVIVVAAYGQFIKPEILALPTYESINIHPSLLPKYRGAAPVQWALANGEKETGVTILYVSERMDAGDIILQRAVPIDPEDTALSLTPRLAKLGAELLIEALDAMRRGAAKRRPQDESLATTVYKLEKKDGRIDWSLPAATIRNRIRGFTPWPGCSTMVCGHRLKILWAQCIDESATDAPGTVVRCEDKGPVVATGDRLLRLEEVQPEGRTRMTGAAYLCGHVFTPGERMGEK